MKHARALSSFERRPIEFHQVCAIARNALQTHPDMSDSEWKALTKDIAARQGYDEPAPDILDRALTNVERALRQTLGPRHIGVPSKQSAAAKPTQDDPPWRHPPAGWQIVRRLLEAMGSAATATATEPDAVVRDITEHQALHTFWTLCANPVVDRLQTLRAFSEIAIVRPPGWDFDAVRRDSHVKTATVTLTASTCFVCGSTFADSQYERRVHWHHVIQIQHGGSNTLRNRVALCPVCHHEVHPWLPPTRRVRGWFSFGEVKE
jgi:hypothetical protein